MAGGGIERLLEAAEEAAKGKRIDVSRLAGEVSEAVAETLIADFEASDKTKEAYLRIIAGAASILASMITPRLTPCRRVYDLIRHHVAGLVLSRRGECIFMRLQEAVKLNGVSYQAGSTACISLEEALGLQAAGLGEALLIGRLPEAVDAG